MKIETIDLVTIVWLRNMINVCGLHLGHCECGRVVHWWNSQLQYYHVLCKIFHATGIDLFLFWLIIICIVLYWLGYFYVMSAQ